MRPHDVAISLEPADGAIEAMVTRVVHLGFEVRIELELPGGEPARVQLTRAQTEELELARGDIVYVRPPVEGAATRAGDCRRRCRGTARASDGEATARG